MNGHVDKCVDSCDAASYIFLSDIHVEVSLPACLICCKIYL